jgi:hypothetical protein
MCLCLGKDGLLQRQLFRRGLEYKGGMAHRPGNRIENLDPLQNPGDFSSAGPHQPQAVTDPPGQGTARLWQRVGHGNILPGAGQGQRDAVAHQPGADHGCLLVFHRSTRRVAAIGVKDVPGVEIRGA